MKIKIVAVAVFFVLSASCFSQQRITPGAERTEAYIPLLKNKSVAVFANQTSMVCHTHLVDTLIRKGVKVVKIFGPEHGFRGNLDDGKKVENFVDNKTGIEVISLYGKHNKP